MRIHASQCLRCGTTSELVKRTDKGFTVVKQYGTQFRKVLPDRTVETHKRYPYAMPNYGSWGTIVDYSMCEHCGKLHYDYLMNNRFPE